MKRKPIKRSPEGQQAYERFKRRWVGKPCWGCGGTFWPAERHHIIGRDGIPAHDDERDLAHLCKMCHSVYHDNGIKSYFGWRVRVVLTVGDVVDLKRRHDPEYFDLEFLRELAGNFEFGSEK